MLTKPALRAVILFVCWSLIYLPTSAQKKNEKYQLNIRKSQGAIVVDGVLDERDWNTAQTASDFFMVLPMDTSDSKVRTVVRMTYDDTNLFLSAECFHALPGPYIVESLRRDFAFGKNDNFLLFMDTFEDQTNGFSFGANAAGAQWDGIMYEGGKVDLSWDNKWISVVKNQSDRWVLEMAIPFKTIRYKKGIDKWGINFSRLDLKTTEKSAWAPVPRQFPTASLAYTGVLSWDQPPPEINSNISIIPYALAGGTRNYQSATETNPEFRADFGVDAKVAVTSSLNLDLTVNPDFSQVEVDRQITNLDRFELFFPERRQFFLENGDLFANFGYSTIRPFFSRRIGLGVPIQYGARFSGKINKDWRVGVMDMQTERRMSDSLPSQNFSVLAVQRRVFARSNVGAIVINKESLGHDPVENFRYSKYNRNVGMEYNLASSNNLWTGKALVLKSFTPGVRSRDVSHAANLQYTSKFWTASWQHEYVGKNYNAEVGYVPRKGFVKINPNLARLFFPKGTRVLSHGPRLVSTTFFNQSFQKTDNENFLLYLVTFRSQAVAAAWVANDYIKLLQPFDPTNSGLDTLARGSVHRWKAWGLEYYSKPQSVFTYLVTMRYGGYYANGTRLNFTWEAGYRIQPFVSLNITGTYNNINLPQLWGNRTFWLLGPRLDVTLTNKFFITAFTQYNEQADNVNLNARVQWRYKPASDLYIVYTDNYFPENFGVKSRAVVLKFTYWWNL